MKILLIYANFTKSPRPAAPIGMAYIEKALKKQNHQIYILDLCWERKYYASVINAIKEYNPDIISISFRNLDNVTFLDPISYVPNLKRIVQCCRKYSKAEIIIGGTGFSVAPINVMKYVTPDYGIIGEGEESIVALLKSIGDKNKLKNIPGLVYIDEDKEVHVNKASNSVNLDLDSIPDRKIYRQEYFKEVIAPNTDMLNELYPPFETIQSKRGCNLGCSYCVIKKVQGNGVRLKNPKLVVQEMKKILQDNPLVEEIEFVDATFNFPIEHAIEICKGATRCNMKSIA